MKKRIKNHLKRVLASRANGALSRGPVTPEGKRKSAKNAVTHGLAALSVLLPGESDERFQQLLDGFTADVNPQSHIAQFQVEQLAIAAWRMRRAQAFEASFVREQLAQNTATPGADTQTTVSRAWADSDAHRAVRYETVQTRHYRLHLDRLLAIQDPLQSGDGFSQPAHQQNQSITCESEAKPNEPSPLPETPQ